MDLMNVRIRNVKYFIECHKDNDEYAVDIYNQMVASMYAEGVVSFEEMLDLLITE